MPLYSGICSEPALKAEVFFPRVLDETVPFQLFPAESKKTGGLFTGDSTNPASRLLAGVNLTP
jgi:hypothetical protein